MIPGFIDFFIIILAHKDSLSDRLLVLISIWTFICQQLVTVGNDFWVSSSDAEGPIKVKFEEFRVS